MPLQLSLALTGLALPSISPAGIGINRNGDRTTQSSVEESALLESLINPQFQQNLSPGADGVENNNEDGMTLSLYAPRSRMDQMSTEGERWMHMPLIRVSLSTLQVGLSMATVPLRFA